LQGAIGAFAALADDWRFEERDQSVREEFSAVSKPWTKQLQGSWIGRDIGVIKILSWVRRRSCMPTKGI